MALKFCLLSEGTRKEKCTKYKFTFFNSSGIVTYILESIIYPQKLYNLYSDHILQQWNAAVPG